MKTIKTNLQLRAMLISACILTALFTTMILTQGFNQF